MYWVNIVLAGSAGLGVLATPDLMRSVLGMPELDAALFGYSGAVPLGFAVLSALGLRAPMAFAPVLLLQLVYKCIYLLGVIAPLAISRPLPQYLWTNSAVFLFLMVGDIWVIPFRELLVKKEK